MAPPAWRASSKAGEQARLRGGAASSVTALAPTHDSFDDWRDEAALQGKTLVIHDEWGAIGEVENQFDSLEHVEEITVTRFGQPIIRYSLRLGVGYRGAPAAAAAP